MRKQFLLPLLVLLMTTLSTHAYDFQSGDLYYNITGENTVEVTYQISHLEGDNYQGLTTATIPETVTYNGTTYSVTSIGYAAFYGCSSLTSITIPNSVTSIGDFAFSDCSSLPVVDNLRYADTYLVEAVDESLSTYTIKAGTKWIGISAFLGCSSLTSISIPNSVTSIGDRAFSGCFSLTSITIPNSVTSIGDHAFYACDNLTSITIPNSVTSIGNSAFYDCSSLPVVDNLRYADTYLVKAVDKSLSTYTIKAGTKWIGDGAFNGCSSLTSITIPNSVTRIGGYAFEGCSALTSITIPNSVTSIGEDAFSGCSSLTSITIPNSVTSIGNYAFRGCSSLTSIVWNAKNCGGWKYSSYVPFYDIRSNITSFTFGDEVETIPSHLCEGMSSLTSLTIGNSVTSIGDRAFQYCSALTSITIPNSVTSIGDNAFRNCSSLTSITCLAQTPPTCGDDCFYGVPRTIPLYVPDEAVEDYKAAAVWQEFNIIAESDAPNAIKNALNTDTKGVQKLLRDGQVVILRNGETYDMMGQRL